MAPMGRPPPVRSLHSLISERSRHSPVDELGPVLDGPFSPASTIESSPWDARTDASDSPSMYSRADMSPGYRAAASIHSRDDYQDYDVGEFTGDSTRTRGRTRTNSTLIPQQAGSPATVYSEYQSPQPSFLSPQLSSDKTLRLSQSSSDERSTLSGSIDSPRVSLDNNTVPLDDALGPKLRFGEKAPWELDSPFGSTSLTLDQDDDDGRRPSLASTLDSEPLSTSSSVFSFRNGSPHQPKSTASFRTRSRSATSAAAGVLKGFGGLVGSSWGANGDKSKAASKDAEDGWAALGLGLEPTDPNGGGLRRKVSSETVMLGADLPRTLERDPSSVEVTGKRSFSSLRIGRSSPTPSRANSTYSTALIYSAHGTILPGSTPSSPHTPVPALPTSRTPQTLSPNPNTADHDNSSGGGFVNLTQHHGLISLGEAQQRQKDRLARPAETPSRGGADALPSPSPSPEPSHARTRVRALTGGSTIKQSSSDASVSSTDSVLLGRSDGVEPVKRTPRSRRMSVKLPSAPSFSDNTFSAPPIPLPTPPKSSVRNKKSIGGVGGLMKMFNKSAANAAPPPLPSPPPSATRLVATNKEAYFYTPHSRSSSGNQSSSPIASVVSSAPVEGSALEEVHHGFSALSNPFRTKGPPPNLAIIPQLSTSDSTESNAALSAQEELADQPAPTTAPNLKLRPVSMAFSSGLPQAYLSSPPPPLPTTYQRPAAVGGPSPAHPSFDVATMLRPPPSPSASSFTTAYSSTSSSNYYSSATGSSAMEPGGSGSSSTGESLLSPVSLTASEAEKDLLIKRLQETLVNERKIWRIQTCEYESQIRELKDQLNPRTAIVVNKSGCGAGGTEGMTTSRSSLLVPGEGTASVLNRGKPKTGGARGVFGSGSLREWE